MAGSNDEKPVVQVLGTKKIGGSGGDSQDRFRLLISDGKFLHSYAMLSTQLNTMHHDGLLDEFAILQINRYITSMVTQNKADK